MSTINDTDSPITKIAILIAAIAAEWAEYTDRFARWTAQPTSAPDDDWNGNVEL